MNEEVRKILEKIEKTRKFANKLTYDIELLYREQHQKKVVEGYEVWRKSDDGRKFVEDQLHLFGHKCPICHTKLTPSKTTIDHLRPKSQYLGDAESKENMLIMCWNCNSAKGTRDIADWCANHIWRDRIIKAIEKAHGKAMLLKLKLIQI